MAAFSDGAAGAGIPLVGGQISAALAAGTALYGLQEVLGEYVPQAEEIFTWTLEARHG